MAVCAGDRSLKRPLESEERRDQRQELAAKRLKTGIRRPYPPRFWDTISKVRLTRQALKELDRRTERTLTLRLTETRGPRPARRLLRSEYRRMKESANKGGPDLSTIRGYSNLRAEAVSMSRSSSQGRERGADSRISRTGSTGRTKTATPYSGEFEQKLIDRGVYPDGYEGTDEGLGEPTNIENIRHILAQRRPSLSPSNFSDIAFAQFKKDNRHAKSEANAMADVIPVIVGAKDKRQETTGDFQFNRLKKFDPDLSIPKPDKYYGAKPTEIDPRVRHDLSEYIVPASRATLPAAPNFFLEGKSASGRPDIAQRQAMYDGAIGARGMFELQNYGSAETTYDGKAYTITSTYHAGTGTLQLYSTHPKRSESGDGTEYHMTQLGAYAMTHSQDTFRHGASAYRNARDWTKQQRDRFIADANTMAQSRSSATTSAGSQSRVTASCNEERVSASETSLDEHDAAHENDKR